MLQKAVFHFNRNVHALRTGEHVQFEDRLIENLCQLEEVFRILAYSNSRCMLRRSTGSLVIQP